MRYITIILTLLILSKQNSYAQNIDSIAIQTANYLKQTLVLEDNQYTTVQDIYRQQLNSINSINALTLTPEQRAIRLQQVNTSYQTALKNTLTVEQWNKYEAACTTTQTSFEQHMKRKQIFHKTLQ